MKPDILILDEPGAGLDPTGKQEILSLIASWNKNNKLTTLMVTHEMDDVAKFAEDVIVMEKGKIIFHDDVRTFLLILIKSNLGILIFRKQEDFNYSLKKKPVYPCQKFV